MAIIVTTYDELKFYIEMFRDGNTDLLVIEGDGGIGKSFMVDDMMKEIPHLKILSHVTPLELYCQGYSHRDVPLVFDDTDCLIQNPLHVSLLKQFSETSKYKEIQYQTTSEILKERNVPLKYTTRSRVLIITNDFRYITKHVKSLINRGFHVKFLPSLEEIMKVIKRIGNNQEIHKFLEKWYKFGSVTLRTYKKAESLYAQDSSKWKERIVKEMEINPKLIEIDKLLQQFDNDLQRLEKWKFSRASFYRYKSIIVANNTENVTPTLEMA